jgi:outer membrane lipopolysaccharide assembly protein LptE/RlpB
MIRRAALLGLAVLLASGCGYSLRPTLPAGIKSVHVPVLENRTQEAGIEDLVTQALTQAVVTSARVKLATRETADASLEGAIITYSVTPLAYDRSANVTQFRVVIGLSLTLRDLRKEAVIWRQDRIEDRADFQVAGQVSRTIVREDDALRRAAVDVARAIVSFAFEGF